MKYKYILIIVIAFLVGIFAIQNIDSISIKMFFWDIKLSSALLIFVSIILGFLIGILVPKRKKD